MYAIFHKHPAFAGQVGPVRFSGGFAETDDPEVVAFCSESEDFDVTNSEGEQYMPPGDSVDDEPDDPEDDPDDDEQE